MCTFCRWWHILDKIVAVVDGDCWIAMRICTSTRAVSICQGENMRWICGTGVKYAYMTDLFGYGTISCPCTPSHVPHALQEGAWCSFKLPKKINVWEPQKKNALQLKMSNPVALFSCPPAVAGLPARQSWSKIAKILQL